MSVVDQERLTAIKAKQQATWASGDYAVIGTTLQLVGESLCESVAIEAGWRVLDVAAGNGNAALAAARRGAEVIAADYVDELLDQALLRAEAEGLVLATRHADAEALPFPEGSFDAVLSTFGVMFTPDPVRAADELQRACRRGGRIGLANWTPDGFVGQMFKIVGAHNPPPADVPSPLAWGSHDRVAELLGDSDVETNVRTFTFRYRSAEHWFETFRDVYGPMVQAWAVLDDDGRTSLRQQLLALAQEADIAGPSSFAAPSTYLEVVATRR